ncbi:hypothetical protein AFV8_gp20 [Betalipothrixvirus puteoliense]|uniref:Uncharacterized protein n=1 Tax=Betalipothrixvirus puteoliense TaxID=346884 RepID=A7WKV0_9VIRU|nr:hypothetical protein AFV8_gp20 [Acidianus filamentous virus 8]CAJ31697.1 conserved hypothetical protein [Acidianus filamentous virus 8]
MTKIMEGERIAKERGCILLERIPKLEEIIKNWDNYKNMFYVAEYDYHYKDFRFYLIKYPDETMRIWAYNYRVEIKRKGNKFHFKFDEIEKIQSAGIASVLNMIFVDWFTFWKNYVNVVVRVSDITFRIDLFSRKIDAVFVLTNDKKELDNSINFCEKSINWKYLALTKLNGKGRKYYVKRFGKLPTPIKVMIRNRKISYAILKMLLNKKIVEKEEFMILPKTKTQLRLDLNETIYLRYYATPIYKFNEDRINLQWIRSIENFTVIDYDYDGTNQIIFKIVTFNEISRIVSALCGIDYRDMLWCIRISDYMRYWKIKSLYKYIYQLDENTKMFEF